MLDRINQLLAEISLAEIKNGADLESFRLRFLSKKGLISELFEDFRKVPAEEKKEIGSKLNLLKQKATEKYNYSKSGILSVDDTMQINDLTRPAYPWLLGSRHPISIIRNEIIGIFEKIGFTVSEGT